MVLKYCLKTQINKYTNKKGRKICALLYMFLSLTEKNIKEEFLTFSALEHFLLNQTQSLELLVFVLTIKNLI